MSTFVIWWMKRDLRILDNAALAAACNAANERRCAALALYICEPESASAPDYHPRRERFVHECLMDLAPKLRALNVELFVAHGRARDIFARLVPSGLTQVFSHEETGLLWTFERDTALKGFFKEHGTQWQEFPSNGVVRGLRDRDRWQGIYRSRMSAAAVPAPEQVRLTPDGSSEVLRYPSLTSAELWPIERAAEHGSLFLAAQAWTGQQQSGGETAAHKRLKLFLQPDVHQKYLANVSRPLESQTSCSRLSPYLAFGCLSSKQVLASLSKEEGAPWPYAKSLWAFRSRLAWRCHFIQKLENFPAMEEQEQNAALKELRPAMSSEELQRWKNGTTGYPLVDACLRSVHATGYLNFRMRAMLMSFATHLLWRDWRLPAWDLAQAFLDFEPGIHFAQVHMQASVTGNNQIRIYNPVKQSADQDPDARFIKAWVPELEDVPASDIHGLQALPSSYPRPMAEHTQALAHARRVLFQRFKDDDVRSEAKKVQDQLGSRSRFAGRKKTTKRAPKARPK